MAKNRPTNEVYIFCMDIASNRLYDEEQHFFSQSKNTAAYCRKSLSDHLNINPQIHHLISSLPVAYSY